jgi:hypothetical protein
MSNLAIINGLSSHQISLIQQSDYFAPLNGSGETTVVAPGNFMLPQLRRIGDTETLTTQSFSRAGQKNELTAQFERVSESIIAVDIMVNGNNSNGVASLDIHLSESGLILGYDTTSNGRINSAIAPIV